MIMKLLGVFLAGMGVGATVFFYFMRYLMMKKMQNMMDFGDMGQDLIDDEKAKE